ncbi:MarR family transcriptional regulator [Luteimonas sp. TWI1416]|uniref:MarR family winged helix-turn-helix transcriptional regulator n=1 Tax=unclassified Luteimonas TaxID=2629088 RepID=UPI003209858C
MELEQKYRALLQQAEQRQLPDVDGMALCFRTLSLAAAIDRDCAALLAPYGLSEGRFVMLFLLEAGEGLAPHALAERAGVTRATVTGLLDGLAREGLIERRADPHDRRALRIHLTRQGKQRARRVFDAHTRWIASLFGGLNPAERTQLATLLDKVAMRLPPALQAAAQ